MVPCTGGYFSLLAKRLYCPAGNCRNAKWPEASVTAWRPPRGPLSATVAFLTGSCVIVSSTDPSMDALPVWSWGGTGNRWAGENCTWAVKLTQRHGTSSIEAFIDALQGG